MKTEITTYLQQRPREWLKQNPHEKWRCDIFPTDGSRHHGTGADEAEAIWNASLAYRRYLSKQRKPNETKTHSVPRL